MIFTLELVHHLVGLMSISRNIFKSAEILSVVVGCCARRHSSLLDSLELTECDGAVLWAGRRAGPGNRIVYRAGGSQGTVHWADPPAGWVVSALLRLL